MNKRVLFISGGGTGGHIFPALAIAQALGKEDPNLQFQFIGAQGRMEMEKIPAAGYPIFGVPMAGFQRSHIWRNLSLPWKVIKSWWMCRNLIKAMKPAAVVGTGGYASAAVGLAAITTGTPLFIQEQNAFAGITNRLLGKRAKRIFVAHPQMEQFFPAQNIVVAGNPVREALEKTNMTKETAKTKLGFDPNTPLVLIVGGSLGALAVNKAMLTCAPIWASEGIQVLWQTGASFAEQAEQAIPAGTLAQVKHLPFIQDMVLAYAAADLVVSRAGAMALAELAITGKPSILVPLPSAAEDHQTHNARSFVNAGAAILIENHRTEAELSYTVLESIRQPEKLDAMGKNALSLAKPGAAHHIAKDIIHQIQYHA